MNKVRNIRKLVLFSGNLFSDVPAKLWKSGPYYKDIHFIGLWVYFGEWYIVPHNVISKLLFQIIIYLQLSTQKYITFYWGGFAQFKSSQLCFV